MLLPSIEHITSRGALIEINQRVKELGYEEFSDTTLLRAAKHPGKIYSSGASFVLHKK